MLRWLEMLYDFFIGLFPKGSNMNIVNGMHISGNSINIHNGKITVDGAVYSNDKHTIIEKIFIDGNVTNLTVDAGNVHVNGVAGDVEVDAGNIEVKGNVMGSVETGAGNITVTSSVAGNVHSDCGNVRVGSNK